MLRHQTKIQLCQYVIRMVEKDWIRLGGSVINHHTVDIVGCGDFGAGTRPRFPNAEKIFIRDCDKNFVYKNVDERRFPNAKELWLISHPCESYFFQRFPNSTIYLLTDSYNYYKGHWFSDQRVKSVEWEELQKEVDSINMAIDD